MLVGENYVLKVADFGLARDIYKEEHYVKTTSVSSINEQTGTAETRFFAVRLPRF